MASYTEDSVELREIMGKNIRERREGCGLSQSQLGKAIGSTQSYISTIENGSGRIVNCVKLYSIAQALDVSMDDLMGRQRSCPQKYTFSGLRNYNQEHHCKCADRPCQRKQAGRTLLEPSAGAAEYLGFSVCSVAGR